MSKRNKLFLMSLSVVVIIIWFGFYFFGRSVVHQLKTEVRVALPVSFSQSSVGERFKVLIHKSLENQKIRVNFVALDVFKNGKIPEFRDRYDLLFIPRSYMELQKNTIYSSLPLFLYNQSVISFKNNKRFNSEKLENFQGALGRNLGGLYTIWDLLPKNLIFTETVKESFFLVRNKKADYFIAPDPFIAELRKMNLNNGVISIKKIYKNEYYLSGAISQKNNIDIIEKSLIDYISKNNTDQDYKEILNYLPVMK